MSFEHLFYCSLVLNFIFILTLVWAFVNNEVNKQTEQSNKALEEVYERYKKEALKQLENKHE